MKTAEMMKFGKGFYVMTRLYGRAMSREWFKTKTAANARIKELKKEGYEVA
jgi:hypothetical protein